MYLKNSKIIVIKIGSSLLVNSKKEIRKKWLSSFAKDIKKLKTKNKKIIIVRFVLTPETKSGHIVFLLNIYRMICQR